ncbi:hypothetical protein CCACVL1_08022 [Corchorus capsularis]|uniref:Uncharacterized protein n=1 Tax=Corchorus capsularis TaxID=210143 RepID=A0A1R3J2R2_COCAP|nr:hypothetical protein CCACVL1_08022 [Corchorus capsularis]
MEAKAKVGAATRVEGFGHLIHETLVGNIGKNFDAKIFAF